jgi:hypothetical protein
MSDYTDDGLPDAVTTDAQDQPAPTVGDVFLGHANADGIVGTMAGAASQFGDIAGTAWNAANHYAQGQGGWGNTIAHAAGGYVHNHGGAAGTALHLGHDLVSAAANAAFGAKDWGDAWRAASQGHWGDALKSAAWGAASVGATASLLIPGAGEAIKGAELAAQGARLAGETVAKDVAETGAKDVVETEAKTAAEEGSNAGKARKAEKVAHAAHEIAGITLPSFGAPQIGPGQQETFTRAY